MSAAETTKAVVVCSSTLLLRNPPRRHGGRADVLTYLCGPHRLLVCVLSFVGISLFAAAVQEIGAWRSAWSLRLVSNAASKPSAVQRWLLLHADLCLIALLCCQSVVLGALLMWWLEGTSFPLGLYFAFVTSSGMGLGDVVPSTLAGQAAVSVYILYSAGVTATAVSLARDALLTRLVKTKARED